MLTCLKQAFEETMFMFHNAMCRKKNCFGIVPKLKCGVGTNIRTFEMIPSHVKQKQATLSLIITIF